MSTTAVVAVVLIVAFFLVLPKIGQVKDANAALAEAQAQQATLGAQLAALQPAETEAPRTARRSGGSSRPSRRPSTSRASCC